jgi:hypothetical protein
MVAALTVSQALRLWTTPTNGGQDGLAWALPRDSGDGVGTRTADEPERYSVTGAIETDAEGDRIGEAPLGYAWHSCLLDREAFALLQAMVAGGSLSRDTVSVYDKARLHRRNGSRGGE